MRYFRGIVESPVAPSIDTLWLYQNELKYFKCGKWEVINNPKVTETEEVPVTFKDSNTLEYIVLEIGKSKNVKSDNLEKLSSNNRPNFVSIEGGFGLYSWDSNTGGQAHIINAYGNTLYYRISNTGIVEKGFESPDIYLEYVNAGGKKTSAEFIQELVDLIG